jgi:capsular exopolysaccharide synthesis family protein
MELKKYFYPLIRWWWLLLTATLVAGVFSFLATLQQPPLYQANTTLMIGRAIENPNPSSNEFWLSQQLAENYADIANRDVIRESTMKALGLNFLPEYSAHALPNSQLIEIMVVDTIPERAQAVASELANQLIQRSPTGAQQAQNQQEFITQQLDAIRVQIQETNDEIERRQGELAGMDSARQITDTQNQITALQGKLSTLQNNYASLFSLTSQGAVNSLVVIEPAGVPTQPIGPGRIVSVLIAAAIGLLLAAVAAYIIEYLDDTIRQPEDVKRLIQAPVLGYIPDMEEEGKSGEGLYVAKNPRHPVVDAYRSLRTNLEFASVDEPLKTLLVSSSDPQVGKTSLACNLAVVMAQGEKQVILLDCDFRRPMVHEFFGVPNNVGLSDVFLNWSNVEDVLKDSGESKLRVITSGTIPPNPTELISSKKMSEILKSLVELADIVIIDGPPFIVPDAVILSAKADGVLLVVRPGFTHESAARGMMEQIKRAGARVVGVALSRIKRKQAYYFGAGGYSSPYYANNSYYKVDSGETQPVRVKGIGRFLPGAAGKAANGANRLPNRRSDLPRVEVPKKSSER